MKYLTTLFLVLIVMACHKCPEGLYSNLTAKKRKWAPPESISLTYLLNDTGNAILVTVPFWNIDTAVGQSTQDNVTCNYLSERLKATIDVSQADFFMMCEIVWESFHFSIPGYSNSLLFEKETITGDTIAEVVSNFELNGVMYEKAIHVKSFVNDDNVPVPEIYYAKEAGLIYLRPHGSAFAWKKY